MRDTNNQIESLEKERVKASRNRGIVGKIDIEELISKATQKIGDLAFEQKKHIVERVIDKIIASPQEIIIWGQIPLPAIATVGKVNYVPQHRYTYCVTQQPFELKLTMPPTDRGGRGYSDKYVAKLQKELTT